MPSHVEYDEIKIGRERITPDPSVRKFLHRKIRQRAGRLLADVRWNELYGCIELVVRSAEGKPWRHWDFLYNGKNIRNIEERDVYRVVGAWHNTEAVDPLKLEAIAKEREAEAISKETDDYERDALKDARMMEARYSNGYRQ